MSYRIIFFCKFCTGSLFLPIVVADNYLATSSVLIRCPFAQQQDFLECTIHKQAGHLLLSLLSACDGRTWPPGLPGQLFSLIQVHNYVPNTGPQIPYARLRGPNTKYMRCLCDGHIWPRSLPCQLLHRRSLSCNLFDLTEDASLTWLGLIGQWTLHLMWQSKNFKEAWMGFSDILR